MKLVKSNKIEPKTKIEQLKAEKHTVELSGFELFTLYHVAARIGGLSDFRGIYSGVYDVNQPAFITEIPKILGMSDIELRELLNENYNIPLETGSIYVQKRN